MQPITKKTKTNKQQIITKKKNKQKNKKKITRNE